MAAKVLRFCPHCATNKRVGQYAKICPACGTKLNKTSYIRRRHKYSWEK